MILTSLVCFVLTGMFAGAETGSYLINRIRLKYRTLHRQRSAQVLSQVLKDPHLFVFTVLTGQNICVYLLSKLVTDQYIDAGIGSGGTRFVAGIIPWNAEMVATLTLMFPLFIFGEVLPKNLFRKRANSLMYRMADILRFFSVLLYPFTLALRELFNLLTRGHMTGTEQELHALSPEGLKEYFSDSTREGVLSPEQNRMLERVISMHRIPVRQLMKPLRQLPKLPEDSCLADFRELVGQQKTTCVVLMKNHRITGLVSLYAVAQRSLEDNDKIQPYAEKVLEVKENQNLKAVFYRLRRHPRHMAVVVNPYKYPVGFIHMKDIARYIAAV